MSLIIDPSSEGDPRNVAPPEERTEAGLVVPKGTIEKKHRVITNDEWKKWRRTVRSMMALGISIGPVHTGDRIDKGCAEPLVPMENELALECGCSKWVIGT